jgi:hypothetical protein
MKETREGRNKEGRKEKKKKERKKTKDNKCWQGCREVEFLYSVAGKVNLCSHYGNQYGGSS